MIAACKVDGCDAPRYRSYARCAHHRHLRSYYGNDEPPMREMPAHGTLRRYRGCDSRPACRCDECRAFAAAYRGRFPAAKADS